MYEKSVNYGNNLPLYFYLKAVEQSNPYLCPREAIRRILQQFLTKIRSKPKRAFVELEYSRL